MKKLGFLFALALMTQSVEADGVGTQYSNVAFAVVETGTSVSWTANLEKNQAPKLKAEELKQKTEQTNLKVNSQLEERIAAMFELAVKD